MTAAYSHRARELAQELTCTAAELLEHVCSGSEFTRTAVSMRKLGELLIRLDRQLEPATASVAVAVTAEND